MFAGGSWPCGEEGWVCVCVCVCVCLGPADAPGARGGRDEGEKVAFAVFFFPSSPLWSLKKRYEDMMKSPCRRVIITQSCTDCVLLTESERNCRLREKIQKGDV